MDSGKVLFNTAYVWMWSLKGWNARSVSMVTRNFLMDLQWLKTTPRDSSKVKGVGIIVEVMTCPLASLSRN